MWIEGAECSSERGDLKWSGHMERRDGNEALKKAVRDRITGSHPPGWPRKACR